MLSYIAGFLEHKAFADENVHEMNLTFFFQFFVRVIQHQSLTVSIPVLHVMTKLLASERIGSTDFMTSLIPSLLGTCIERLVRWESLPSDSDNPTAMFLNEDIDTTPEKHAFAGNYRRYCSSIVETTVLKRPAEAIQHILGVVDQNVDNLYTGVEPFSRKSSHQEALCMLTRQSENLHEDLNTAHARGHPVFSGRSSLEGLQ